MALVAQFTVIACAAAQQIGATNPVAEQVASPFLPETIESAAIARQKEKDLQRISLGQASRFHRTLVSALNPVLPENVTIQNDGPLARPSRYKPLTLNGLVVGGGITIDYEGVSDALSWSVEGDLGIFGFWISTARTQSTVAICSIDGMELFLNVDFVAGNRSVDEKLPELGGRSVRETLRLVEQACAKKPQSEGAEVDESGDPPREPLQRDRARDGKAEARSDFSDFHELIELIQEENEQESQPAPARIPERQPDPPC